MKHKKKYKLLFLLLIISIGLHSCSSKINKEEQNDEKEIVRYKLEPEYGGKVVLPLTNFRTLNPLLVENSYYYHFSKLIFEPLFEFSEDLSPEAILVDDYSISADGKTINIKLKDSILWHDNTTLSTEDVGFTIDVIKSINQEGTYGKIFNESLGVYNSFNLNTSIGYKIVDQLQMEIIFDNAYSNKLDLLTFPIIPKHIFSDISDAKKIENYIPVGTGPFKYKNYDKFKSLSLEANDNYWKGRPYIDEVIGKVLDDEKLVQIGFDTGQINIAPASGVDWHKFKDSQDVYAYEYLSNSYEFLGFNFDKNIFQDEKGQNLRKAINYGIDRMDIIQRVYLGHGIQTDVPTFPDSYLSSVNSSSYGYNKDRAVEILNELGYKDYNENGFLINENNETISFNILTNRTNILRQRTAEIIVEYLIDLGLDVKLEDEIMPEGASEEEIAYNEWLYIEDRIINGNFDVVLTGWSLSPVVEYTPLFHSNSIGKRTNFIKFSSEKFNEILENNFISIDIQDKIDKHEIFEEYFTDVLPYVSILYRNNGLLVDKKIKGGLEPQFINMYKGLNEAYINVKTK